MTPTEAALIATSLLKDRDGKYIGASLRDFYNLIQFKWADGKLTPNPDSEFYTRQFDRLFAEAYKGRYPDGD